MPNVMSFPTRIVHGRGSARELPNELKRAGAKERVFLVTDQGILKANLLRFVVPQLEHAGLKVTVWPEAQQNPTEQNAIAGAAAYKSSGADALLGVGGGSALDLAKAIALLAGHEPPLARFDDSKGEQSLAAPLPPLVLVPTQAGTGAEVSRSAVLVIDDAKVSLGAPHLHAAAAILDAELTVALPGFATATAGMGALAHNLEAFVAKGDHPIADAIALDGLRRIAKSLKTAVKNGRDLDAREQLLLASAMGGAAAQKGLGASQSLAHALTAVSGTPHGLAHALVLPTVVHFNLMAAEAKLAEAAVALGFDPRAPAAEAAAGLPALISKLRQECGLPGKLSQAGVKREQLSTLVEKALADSSHLSNPRSCSEVDFERMLNEAF